MKAALLLLLLLSNPTKATQHVDLVEVCHEKHITIYIFYNYSPDYRRFEIVDWCHEYQVQSPPELYGGRYKATLSVGCPRKELTIYSKMLRTNYHGDGHLNRMQKLFPMENWIRFNGSRTID